MTLATLTASARQNANDALTSASQITTAANSALTAVAAAVAELNAIKGDLDAIDALPPAGGMAPLTWPAGQICIDQTNPWFVFPTIAGDVDSGGFPEPYYTRLIEGCRTGMVHIFGDSILQGIPASMISPFGVNFAIGGQQMRRLMNRLVEHNANLQQAGAVCLLSGVNELGNTTGYATQQDALNALQVFYEYVKHWARGVWVVHHCLPCVAGTNNWQSYNAGVTAINAIIDTQCALNSAITVVPNNPALLEADGSLKASCASSDGQHPNKAGKALIAADFYAALVARGVNP